MGYLGRAAQKTSNWSQRSPIFGTLRGNTLGKSMAPRLVDKNYSSRTHPHWSAHGVDFRPQCDSNPLCLGEVEARKETLGAFAAEDSNRIIARYLCGH